MTTFKLPSQNLSNSTIQKLPKEILEDLRRGKFYGEGGHYVIHDISIIISLYNQNRFIPNYA